MFISHLLDRSIRIEADLIDQLFNSSEKRLARLLLLLAQVGKEDGFEPMIVKISQEMLAEKIGTTRARVSFFLNKFKKLRPYRRQSQHSGPQLIIELDPARSATDQKLKVNFVKIW